MSRLQQDLAEAREVISALPLLKAQEVVFMAKVIKLLISSESEEGLGMLAISSVALEMQVQMEAEEGQQISATTQPSEP